MTDRVRSPRCPSGAPVAPVAPDEPTLNLAQLRETLLGMIWLLDTPNAAKVPAAFSLQATIHERDVRVANKNLPKLSSESSKKHG